MSKQKKNGASLGDKFLAAVAGLAGIGVGFYLAPLLVQVSIVAGIVLVFVPWSVAKTVGASVGELLGLLVGKALVGGFKGAAIGLIEWPLRAAHRAGARFEVRLRLQLGAARTAYSCWDGTAALVRGLVARSNPATALEAARATGALVLIWSNRITGRPDMRVDSVRESA